MTDFKLIANAVDVNGVPDVINVLPLGHINSQKGNFIVDQESFNLVYASFKERKLDIVIDYEHQTLHGSQAPAGGWIKDLSLGKDGIMAKVEWTSKAREYLKNKEYRYLSPVILVRKRDNKATSLQSVALTNTPAIDGMKAIVNSMKGSENLEVNETTTPIETEENPIIQEIETNQAAESEFQYFAEELRSLLTLAKDSSYEDIITSIKDILNNSEKTQDELNTMKYNLLKQDVDDAVSNAMKIGKITAAMQPMALKMAQHDLVAFKDYIRESPTIVPMGKMDLVDMPQTDNDYTESKASTLLRISKEDYNKYSK